MTSDVTIYLTGQKCFIFIGLIERTTLKLSRWNPFLLFSTCDSLDPENVFFIVPANWLDSQASGLQRTRPNHHTEIWAHEQHSS